MTTVAFGGQVKAIILFLNAICSQAGREPLGGSCSEEGLKSIKVLSSHVNPKFPSRTLVLMGV